jgi:hypothetical protein
VNWDYNWYTPFYRRVSADAVITWRRRDGTLLGRTRIDFNEVSDYHCVGGPGLCQVYASAAVGAYFYFPPLF